jgi:electron transfer flavoprotein beta subunit
MTAEILGLPHASIVMEIEADPDTRCVRVLREMESNSFERLELNLPAVLTVQAGGTPLRFPSLKGIMQAKKKEIRKLPVSELESSQLEAHLEIQRLYVPVQETSAELLEGPASEVVERLLSRLAKLL